jgi:hypothetical protein
MKTSNADNNIKEKLAQREIAPSTSVWERLSAELDGQPKQKTRNWFLYVGYAATILILISVGMYTFSNNSIERMPLQDILVNQEIDTLQILHKIEEVFNEVPLEKALVKSELIKEKQSDAFILKKEVVSPLTIAKERREMLKKVAVTRALINVNTENSTVVKVEENKAILIPITETSMNKTPVQQNRDASIKVNAKDLLYAVTNESKNPLTISVERKTSRKDLLITIKSELKKSNLTVDPKIILAEVERTIKDDFFQNNFLKIIKTNITKLSATVANRNN